MNDMPASAIGSLLPAPEKETACGTQRAVLIVAHPDDETLWAGGFVLARPRWEWHVACLCRKDDPDRAPRFARALQRLGARGTMGELDDGPEQKPLSIEHVAETALRLLPGGPFDLVLTHAPWGEYTRHRRHEEAGRAVTGLWERGGIVADALWIFAYDDLYGTRLPRAVTGADVIERLTRPTWEEKYSIIREVYGFGEHSFEARTTPAVESFWSFPSPSVMRRRLRGTRLGRFRGPL